MPRAVFGHQYAGQVTFSRAEVWSWLDLIPSQEINCLALKSRDKVDTYKMSICTGVFYQQMGRLRSCTSRCSRYGQANIAIAYCASMIRTDMWSTIGTSLTNQRGSLKMLHSSKVVKEVVRLIVLCFQHTLPGTHHGRASQRVKGSWRRCQPGQMSGREGLGPAYVSEIYGGVAFF